MVTKKLLPLLVGIAMACSAHAQSFSYGPRVGATISSQNFAGEGYSQIRETLEMQPRSGFFLGIVSNLAFSETLSLQPEFAFIQKGAKPNFSGLKSSRWSNYLELPLLGKLHFGTEQIRGFLTAGPTVAYLLSAKEESKIGGIKEHDFKQGYHRRFEAGVNLGLGFAYSLGKNEVNFDLRYGHGLSKLYNETMPEKAIATHRSYSFSFAYLIPTS